MAKTKKNTKTENLPVKKQNRKQPGTKKVAKKIKTSPKKAEDNALTDIDEEALERDDAPMSIVGHLHEMRSRLIVSLSIILSVFLISFFLFSDYLLNIINEPFIRTGLKLNVFNISEGFVLKAKAALVAGIFAGLPVIVFEIWKYIMPAIDKNNRKFIRRSIIAAVLLLYTGATLTYFFLMPVAVKMLLKFTPDDVNNIIGASKYLTFTVIFCVAMGILCELPIVIMILTKIGLITPRLLTTKRKYAIVLIWIFAAVLTPGPDILSQALVAIPIMFLYEVSIIISKIIMKRKLKYG